MQNENKLNDKDLDKVSGGKGQVAGPKVIKQGDFLWDICFNIPTGTYCMYSIGGVQSKNQYFQTSPAIGVYDRDQCINKICWDECWNYNGVYNIHMDIVTVEDCDRYNIIYSFDWTDTLRH